MERLIGREKEISALNTYIDSDKEEFVAIYGRRRVGKTFLIRQFFNDDFDFYVTGIIGGTKIEELGAFNDSLTRYGYVGEKAKDWMTAFSQLATIIEEKSKIKNRVAEMAKYFETSDITPDDADSARYCRLMLKLLAIATDNGISYYTPPEMEFVKDGNLHTIKFVGEGKMAKYVNTANAHRYIADYQDSPSMRNTLRCEKAWHLYNQMRLQYLRHCWD